MVAFPSHPDAVTPGWLGEVLGAPVAGLAWEKIGTGQVGDSVRFRLEGEGVPPTLAAKFPAADPTSRGTAQMLGLYRKEVGFYRHAAAQLAVRVPEVRFAAIDEAGGAFILLFEDLAPARGGNQLVGCSFADAAAAIRQAAAFHAPSWERADLLEAGWIQSPPGANEQVAALYPQAQAVFRERYADLLEPEYMALAEDYAAAYARGEVPALPPQCLVHGDFRLDNLLFDIGGGAEPVAVLDWQTVTTGRAMTDIGYFLGCGIGDDLRRAHEEALLTLYLDAMAARGVSLTREDIWRDYRLGALHGLSTAVFSAAFVERTERGDANFLSMARGACALALAHDSLGALREQV